MAMDPPSATSHKHQLSQSSTPSDMPSPSSTSSSTRGHSRLASSTSSLASSPTMHESMEGFGTGKSTLTDVKEEPHERDEDYEMIDRTDARHWSFTRKLLRDCRWAKSDPSDRTVSMDYGLTRSADESASRLSNCDWSLDDPGAIRFLEYDLADDALEHDFAPRPSAKRQRAESSPFTGLASRMGSIKPSLSRKWKSRKGSPTISVTDKSREPSLSRDNSTRAPSFVSATLEPNKAYLYQLPPTPTRSALDESFEDSQASFIDTAKANTTPDDDLDYQAKPNTPLLPPIMTQIPDHLKEVPYQSPLQSPTVADPDASSVLNTPLPTPQITSLPSPPLSTKPSIASFHRHPANYNAIVPSSEIPPMLITDPTDEWASALGHANYTIEPTLYTPSPPTLASFNQLRSDWDAARFAYAKHLVRTSEHYGPTSKIYLLTEEKWTATDAAWKQAVDACFAVLPGAGGAALDASGSDAPPLRKMPSLNGPKSEGKFPTMGDEGIVGPMEVVAPPPLALQQGQKRKRKLGFLRWVQGWAQGVGR